MSDFNLKSVPAFSSRTADELRVLWSAELPPDRDTNPALWDTLLGFFEDMVSAICSRSGSLVVSERTLLRQLKLGGREPTCGRAVLNELFRRGDIARAENLAVQDGSTPSASSAFSIARLRSTLSHYVWGPAAPAIPSMDDPIVSIAALDAAADRAEEELGGPVSSDDVQTLDGFAKKFTAGNTKDATAIIGRIVERKKACVLYTDPTKDSASGGTTRTMGFKFGVTVPSEADKGVLQTKAALERMEQLTAHLEKSAATATAGAMEAAKSGDKQAALAHMRKKKLFENKLAGARASAHKLSDVLMAVDEAASNKEAVEALEVGMESLRTANAGGVSVERVDAIASDFSDAVADQEDVRLALQQLNTATGSLDTSVEEAELDALLAGDNPDAVSDANTAPDDPELARIMAELGINSATPVKHPTPPTELPATPEARPAIATSPAAARQGRPSGIRRGPELAQ